MLTLEGAQCIQASNGVEALAQLDSVQMQLDLILLDCIMPEMDGYAAATEMRRRGYTRPIIAITGCSLEADLYVFFYRILFTPFCRSHTNTHAHA